MSLVVLESILRFVGWTISSYQCYKNDKTLKNKSKYRIMCLGESTTAGQYPIQLQKILDKKYPNKFSVIDCGIPGTTLEYILDSLDNNIDKYKPDIAICMMGGIFIINFNEKNKINTRKKFIYKLKFMKMLTLCIRYLKLGARANLFVYDESEDNNENIVKLIARKQYEEAEKILKKILEKEPDNQNAFVDLMLLYSDLLGEQQIGYNMALEGLRRNFDVNRGAYYMLVFRDCFRNNEIDKLKYYIEKLINEDISVFSTDLKYFIYRRIMYYINDQQKDKIINTISKKNIDDTTYGFLAINAIEQKNYKKAQEYFDKAEEIRLNFPNTKIYNLYKLIIKKLIDNNIKVICMQYPVRSIDPLRKQLENELYYKDLVFVSNERLFKEALMKNDYRKIFTDQFAGDFGHNSDVCNEMIAKNVVNTLEKILKLQQKN